MKQIAALTTAVLLILFCALPCFAAGFTYAPTPVADTELLFTRRLGTGYRNAPTPVAAGNGCIYVAAGKKLYKLDAGTEKRLPT